MWYALTSQASAHKMMWLRGSILYNAIDAIDAIDALKKWFSLQVNEKSHVILLKG